MGLKHFSDLIKAGDNLFVGTKGTGATIVGKVNDVKKADGALNKAFDILS